MIASILITPYLQQKPTGFLFTTTGHLHPQKNFHPTETNPSKPSKTQGTLGFTPAMVANIYIYTHLQRVPLLYIRKGAMCDFHQGLAESQSQFGRGTSKKGLCLGRSRSLEDGGTIVGYKGFLTLQNHEEMN